MTVRVDFRKWRDTAHRQFDMERLGEDEHGMWLWSPPGMEFRRGTDAAQVSAHTLVELITNGAWWTAIWNAGEARHAMYVDIATPAKWKGDHRVVLVDLDRDIVRYRDGGVEVLDEDEFDEHRVDLGYPPHIVDGARAATALVYLDVVAGREPFGDVSRRWLAVATALGEGT